MILSDKGIKDEQRFSTLIDSLTYYNPNEMGAPTVELGPWQIKGDMAMAMGSFVSPVAEHFPQHDNIQTAHFQIVVPAAGNFCVQHTAYYTISITGVEVKRRSVNEFDR